MTGRLTDKVSYSNSAEKQNVIVLASPDAPVMADHVKPQVIASIAAWTA